MPERRRFEQELSDLDLREYQTDPNTAQKPRRQIILAAGVEYPRYSDKAGPVRGKSGKWWKLAANRTIPERNAQTGSHWRQKCLRLAQQRLKKDPTLVVWLYDFDRATRELVKLDKTKKVETTVDHNFPALVDKNYRRLEGDKRESIVLKPVDATPLSTSQFKKRPYIAYFPSLHKVLKKESDEIKRIAWIAEASKLNPEHHGLNIHNVYQHIERIGKQEPYTLQEFHSFGHASSSAYGLQSGTAFVNTDHPGPLTKRHPLDLDARAGLDFQPASINQDNFRMAFALGAMSYVWGCNWEVPVFRMILAVNRLLGKKPLTDDAKFKFEWHDEKQDFEELTKRAGCVGAKWTDKSRVVELDGKCVRAILKVQLIETYMQKLAEASAHCVTGGLPATYSDYDNKSEKGEPLLAHIPMGKLYCTPTKSEKCDVDLRGVMAFFARHFKITFNKDGAHSEFGRGYVVYRPSI